MAKHRAGMQLVDDDEETSMAETKGEELAQKIMMGAEVGTVPLAAYAASRPELPTIVRVGFGVVAVAKSGAWLRRMKRWWQRDVDE